MEMRISVHSIIDVITNSSTTVFVTVSKRSVQLMFDLIDEILKIAGSDKKAEDLFKVEIDRDWYEITERFLEDYSEEYSKLEEIAIMKGIDAATAPMGYSEAEKYTYNTLIPFLKEKDRYEKYNTNHLGYANASSLIVKAINTDKSTIDIWEKIMDIFNVEGYYEG